MRTESRKVLAFLARLVLGGVLLSAGWLKARSPSGFAETLANYRMLPASGNQIVAVVLPWWEIGAGVLVALGLWVGTCARFSALLFTIFLIAVSSAVFRGLDIECGCFGTGASRRVGASVLGIDVIMIFLSVIVAKTASEGSFESHRFNKGVE